MHDVAAIVPIKTNNERLPGKNTKALCGIPLFHYLYATLQRMKTLSEVFVDSSDEYILTEARSVGFTPIKRPDHLNAPCVQGNDLLEFELQTVRAPIVAQVFVTSPFLSAETIDGAIVTLVENENVDSVFGVYEIHNRFWFRGHPVNHDYSVLAGTQRMEPIQCEADFYVMRRAVFLREKSRITQRHRAYKVPAEEAVDIDTELDFIIAEAIYRHKAGTTAGASPVRTVGYRSTLFRARSPMDNGSNAQ